MANKKSKNTVAGKAKTAIVSPKVGNYEKHPFFVKKKEQAKAFLNKAGLPTTLAKNSN